MTTNFPGPGAPRRRARLRCGLAMVSLVAGLGLGLGLGSGWATPAGAMAAPTADVPPRAAVAAELNLALLAGAVALGLAIGVPLTCRDRLAREFSVRRFRALLEGADVLALAGPQESRPVEDDLNPGG